jgi:membrane-bound acyltransferase YfiQ involved in biofilm formation
MFERLYVRLSNLLKQKIVMCHLDLLLHIPREVLHSFCQFLQNSAGITPVIISFHILSNVLFTVILPFSDTQLVSLLVLITKLMRPGYARVTAMNSRDSPRSMYSPLSSKCFLGWLDFLAFKFL